MNWLIKLLIEGFLMQFGLCALIVAAGVSATVLLYRGLKS